MHLLLLLTQIAFCTGANWKLLALLFNHYQIPPVNHLLISVVKPYLFYSQITSFAIYSARLLQPCSGKEKGATIYPDGYLCGEHTVMYMSYMYVNKKMVNKQQFRGSTSTQRVLSLQSLVKLELEMLVLWRGQTRVPVENPLGARE